ncbi:MAG: hypothetical protein KAI72_08035 [Candidatus Pacebacteria bacterium]|nr:hypothetical protein [Candidatus Paceibacterota bacterium]
MDQIKVEQLLINLLLQERAKASLIVLAINIYRLGFGLCIVKDKRNVYVKNLKYLKNKVFRNQKVIAELANAYGDD